MKQKQGYSDLDYFKYKLDIIAETSNKVIGLLPNEKREFRQKLSVPMIYAINGKFKITGEGRHTSCFKKKKRGKKKLKPMIL